MMLKPGIGEYRFAKPIGQLHNLSIEGLCHRHMMGRTSLGVMMNYHKYEGAALGRPVFFATDVMNTRLYVWPIPNQDYICEIVFYPPLDRQ